MLDKDKKEILNKNYFLNSRKDAVKKTKFVKSKHRFFLLGIALGLILIIGAYFISDYSNIYHVVIEGNVYYTDEEVRAISGISDDDKFLLVDKKNVKQQLENDTLIKNATIEKLDDKVIRITVEEYKIIGYVFEDETTKLVLINDDRIDITKDNMRLINQVPLIAGYDKEGLSSIEKGFENISIELISEISEIHHYSFSYDENMMELIMHDGNYCFVSSIGLHMLSQYYNVISNLEVGDEKQCLYVDEVTNTYQNRACPWEKVEYEIPEDLQETPETNE